MKLKMVVEWSAGSLERYDYKVGELVRRPELWPEQWGALPVNYGCIPTLWNPHDQGYVDALWADPRPLEVGTWLEGQVLGMLWLNDLDHKVVLGGHLEAFPFEPLQAWFAHREVRLTSADEAIAFLQGLPAAS